MKHFIITFTKAHYEITEEQRKNIMALDLTKNNFIDLNGVIVKSKNIAEILPENEYYQQYPDKRPASEYNQFEDIYGDIGNQQIRQPVKRAKELMKQGFMSQLGNKTDEEKEKAFSKFNVGLLENKEKAYWQDVYNKYKDKDRNLSEEYHFNHALKVLKI